MKSLIYLDRKVIDDVVVKNDVDFLLNLLQKEGLKKKRWEVYLNDEEFVSEDGNVDSHSIIMENLAYAEGISEGLSKEIINTLVWTARLHDLGELKFGDRTFNLKDDKEDIEEAQHIEDEIKSQLKSEYAREMLDRSLSIALFKRNIEVDEFNYVDFFNSLERRGYLRTAIFLAKNKSINQWDVLLANVFFNQLIPLIEYATKYKSVYLYLKKNKEDIAEILEKYFTLDDVEKSFILIYGADIFQEKKKHMDISKNKINEIRGAWNEFIKE